MATVNGNGRTGPVFRVEFEWTAVSEFDGDHWVTYNSEFRMTTYGKTREESESAMGKSIGLMMDRLARRGPAAVDARLNALGIPHVMNSADEKQVHRYTVTERKEIVAVG